MKDDKIAQTDAMMTERFNPANRSIAEEHLRKHDGSKKKLPASQFIRLEFSASIPQETKILLSERLPRVIDFADEFDLHLWNPGHLLRFLGQADYETEVGSPLPENVSLPASRLDFNDVSRIYTVTVILPKKLQSGEIIVNIIRTLFSKLFGSIYFDEQIRPLEFYQQNSSGVPQASAAVPEILDLIQSFDFASESLNGHCESVAKTYRLSIKKQGGQIRKQVLGEWREKWNTQTLTTEEQHTLSSIFTEFQEAFRTNPEDFYQNAIEHLKQLNAQSPFILPHERKAYEQFERERPAHYLRSVLHKFEEIFALAGFVEELYSQLSESPETAILDGVATQIRFRMLQLRREKKVVLFYVPEMPLNPALERLRKKFPLRLLKMLPPGTPIKQWSKEVKRMEKHYANSLYAKLYTALHSLSEWATAQQEFRAENFEANADGQRLRQMLQIFKFRLPIIQTMKNSLGVLLDTGEDWESQSGRQLLPLEDFSKAWSYFIAFVLTLLYYQKSGESASLPAKNFRSENYLKSILNFIDKQCARGINYFHIVKLLWLIYEDQQRASEKCSKNKDGLSFLIYCIKNPLSISRFIFHQMMCPQNEGLKLEQRLEKLTFYQYSLLIVYRDRLREIV